MEWQKCPICNGSGQVSGGFYNHAGDYPYWASDRTMEMCRTCNGQGMIVKPELESEEYCVDCNGEVAIKLEDCPRNVVGSVEDF